MPESTNPSSNEPPNEPPNRRADAARSNDGPARPARPGDAIALTQSAWIAPRDARFSFSRSGGPGGQHVNTTSTRAELRVALAAIGGMHPEAIDRLRDIAKSHLIASTDELRIVNQESRSQLDNREACLERLRVLVRMAQVRPRVRKKTKPTRGSKERRLKAKREHGEKKQRRQKPRQPDDH